MKQPLSSALSRLLHLVDHATYVQQARLKADKYRDEITELVNGVDMSLWASRPQVYSNLEIVFGMSNRNQFAFIVDEGGDQRWIIVTPDIAEGLMYRITGASSVGEEDWLERCLSKAFTQEVQI
jgi:hypothetical protein